jgi:hypothetical protein
MERPSSLERRLRERRYEKASRTCAEILEGIGIAASEYDIVSLDDVESIWPRYLTRLREGAESAERWPAAEREALQDRLDTLADALDGLSVVWLALIDSEPVGVKLSADVLLRAALTLFVSRAGDLMLTTRDGRDGVCVELNHLATGDEYELVAWGAFAP